MKKIAGILLIIFLFLHISCKKNLPDANNDIQSVLDNICADDAMDGVFTTINDYATNYLGKKGTLIDSNSIVTISPQFPLDSFPKTMIIDYGNGVYCTDGKTRKGKIIAVLNKRWIIDSITNGLTAEVTTEKYIIDNDQLAGSFIITFNGNSDNQPSFTVNTSNAKLTFENGENTQWIANKTTKWISGFENINDINDDVFLITGNNTGINRKGLGYEADIISPLRYEVGCLGGTVTQGKLEIIPQDISKRTLNFGDGDCDKIAKVTINGVTVDISF